jgi:hypothetical protein
MARVTHVYTIEYAAKLLGEDPELLEAIISRCLVPGFDGAD